MVYMFLSSYVCFHFSVFSKLIGTKRSTQRVQVFVLWSSQNMSTLSSPCHHFHQESSLQRSSSPDTHSRRGRRPVETSGKVTQGFDKFEEGLKATLKVQCCAVLLLHSWISHSWHSYHLHSAHRVKHYCCKCF